MELNYFIEADAKLCIGCKLCEIACALVHMPEAGATAGSLKHALRPRLWLVQSASLSAPVHCHHCEDAPCVLVCPTNAIEQKGHARVVNLEICVGCKQCILACPFGAIDIDTLYRPSRLVVDGDNEEESVLEERIVAAKCDLCQGLSEIPACVSICPQKALRLVNPEEDSMEKAIHAAQLKFMHTSIEDSFMETD